MAPQDFANILDGGQAGNVDRVPNDPISYLAGLPAYSNTNPQDEGPSETFESSSWVNVDDNNTARHIVNGEAREDDLPIQELMACGIQPDDQILVDSLEGKDLDGITTILNTRNKRRRLVKPKGKSLGILRIDFFERLAQYPELFMELAKHLRMPELISLYAISKDFHLTVNGHLSHIMKSCAAYVAPESAKIFVFTLYASLCIPDPVGRPHPVQPNAVRPVPSLRWLAMIQYRERTVRDILACMAREGHRMPKSMSLTLKKMWLTMDIATSARRVQLMHNERYWTNNDIYNVQMFLIKLDMRFNDPIDGPGDDGLKKLMMGQKGLGQLCKLLKRQQYTAPMEIVQAALRYSYIPRPEHRGMSIFGIPPEEIGKGHLEGWGTGRVHLYRMDELVMREAARRHLDLDDHMMMMLVWGYVDPVTKQNIKVSDEEMYMSDESFQETKNTEEIVDGDHESPDTKMLDRDGDEWETDDEDMADESMHDDAADAGAIGSSGWRRLRRQPSDQ